MILGGYFAAERGKIDHDPSWCLPLWKGDHSWLASPIADLNNVSLKPFAGAVVAALFLQRFVTPSAPRVHLDMHGTISCSRMTEGGEAQAIRGLFAGIERRFTSSEFEPGQNRLVTSSWRGQLQLPVLRVSVYPEVYHLRVAARNADGSAATPGSVARKRKGWNMTSIPAPDARRPVGAGISRRTRRRRGHGVTGLICSARQLWRLPQHASSAGLGAHGARGSWPTCTCPSRRLPGHSIGSASWTWRAGR